MLKALTFALAGTLPLVAASAAAAATPPRFSAANPGLSVEDGNGGIDDTEEAASAASDLAGRNALILSDVQVTPTNAGINPDAFAYIITATVMKGSNRCVAANTQVGFVQQRRGDEIHVRAVRRTLDPSRICTMEYAPVYVTLTTTVRAFSSQVDAVILENVDERGHDVNLQDLL